MERVNSPPMASTTFFTPLLISLIGVVSTALAIVAYHLVVVRCLRRPQSLDRAELPIPEGPLPTGVDEKVLQTIPIIAYSPENADLFRVDQTECTVCLGELEDGEMIRLLPNCKHAFHVACIDKWFWAHTSCPICRSPFNIANDQVLPMPNDEPNSSNLEPQDQSIENERNTNIDSKVDGGSASTSETQNFGLLRHCASLVLPREKRPSRLVTGLKRSMSMDLSFFIIDIEAEGKSGRTSSSSSTDSDDSSSSPKGELLRSISLRAISMKQLDRVSSQLLKSFRRLGMRGGNGILSY